jgi:hypothetical protein
MPLQISNFLAITLLLFVLGVITSVVVALFGIRASIRRSNTWRLSLAILVALNSLLVLLIASNRVLEDSYANFKAWRYTFHPKVPATFDGILFPAGSTVIENPDDSSHSVTGGFVPVDMTLLGLKIHGDFAFEHEQDKITDAENNMRYISESTLVEPAKINLIESAKIHDVPCGPGKFKHTIPLVAGQEELDCTITENYTINGIAIPSNSDVEITNDHSNIEVNATVKHPWKFSTIECASGRFSTYIGFECPLAHDQVLNGYPIAARDTTFRFDGDGTAFVSSGVLSRDFEALGIVVPAGSTLNPPSAECESATAGELLSHKIPGLECVKFLLPEKTPITVAGRKFEANHINLDFSNQSITVITASNGYNADEHIAEYDITTHKWCEDEQCR